MSDDLYPIGYGRELVTIEELKSRYAGRMHPEYSRRLFGWIKSKGGNIGIGSAWRPTPDPVSEASRQGRSFHQDQKFSSGLFCCSAVDLVARNGSNVHRAPYWSEVPKQGTGHPDIVTFGVHCNVSNEPWHIQCVEMDGYVTWVNAGRQDPPSGQYSGDDVIEVPPDANVPWPPFDPKNCQFGLWPLNEHKPVLRQGSTGDSVMYLQGVIYHKAGGDIGIDGQFGPQTARRVRDVQRLFKLQVDGICGPATWGVIDWLSAT